MSFIQWLTGIMYEDPTNLMNTGMNIIIIGVILIIIIVIIPLIVITYMTFRSHPYPKHRHNKALRLRLKTRRPVGMQKKRSKFGKNALVPEIEKHQRPLGDRKMEAIQEDDVSLIKGFYFVNHTQDLVLAVYRGLGLVYWRTQIVCTTTRKTSYPFN